MLDISILEIIWHFTTRGKFKPHTKTQFKPNILWNIWQERSSKFSFFCWYNSVKLSSLIRRMETDSISQTQDWNYTLLNSYWKLLNKLLFLFLPSSQQRYLKLKRTFFLSNQPPLFESCPHSLDHLANPSRSTFYLVSGSHQKFQHMNGAIKEHKSKTFVYYILDTLSLIPPVRCILIN